MSGKNIVIVGGGQAAAQAVASLRQEGFIGRIVLVGSEPELPYQRPPLSKGYLSGETAPERLPIRDRAFYQHSDIEVRVGVTVTGIRLADRTVQMDNGESLGFDDLVLTTGSRPKPLNAVGADHPRLFQLRTLADVRAIQRHFVAGARLVLVGGGYIGLEVAATARKLGVQVCVLEAAPQLLARVTGPVVGDFFRGLHRQHGVDVRCRTTVTRIEGPADQPSVVTHDGERITADLIIAGIGAVPNIELAIDAGLICNHGIVIDEFCRTSVPGIYAAGDCTEQSSPLYSGQIRLESVPNAIEQARTMAATICGKPRANSPVPWFWSDQYDVKLQSAGLSHRHDRFVVRGDPAQRSFATFYFHRDRLIAVDAINRPAEFSLAKAWIAERRILSPDRLADDATPAKSIAA